MGWAAGGKAASSGAPSAPPAGSPPTVHTWSVYPPTLSYKGRGLLGRMSWGVGAGARPSPFFLWSSNWESPLTWLTCLPPTRCAEAFLPSQLPAVPGLPPRGWWGNCNCAGQVAWPAGSPLPGGGPISQLPLEVSLPDQQSLGFSGSSLAATSALPHLQEPQGPFPAFPGPQAGQALYQCARGRGH